jgi:hypothetical protein
VAGLVQGLAEPGVPVVLGAAVPAPQRHMVHAPAALGCFPGGGADARQPGDFLRHTGSKRMPVRVVLGFCARRVVQASDDDSLSCKFQAIESCDGIVLAEESWSFIGHHAVPDDGSRRG